MRTARDRWSFIIRYRPSRRVVLGGLGATVVAGALGYELSEFLEERELAAERDRVPHPSTAWTDRVRHLHERLDHGDFAAAALSAGYLSDEAFTRANRATEAWLTIGHEYKGLLPKSIGPDGIPHWNYRDCASDLYGHLIIESYLLAPQHLDALRDILAKERSFSKGLPQAININTGELVDSSLDQRIFGAVEYCKDGLLPILERIGPTPWLDRMREVTDQIIEASPLKTRFGRLPSDGTETNGQFLQVLARLYQRERNPRHLAAGRAIVDAYTEEVLPMGAWLPAQHWDFDTHKAGPATFRMRDHGNEIITGLAEWMMLEAAAPDSRAETYRPPVERMLDTVLDHGRDTLGMWDSHLRYSGPTPSSFAVPTNDNWGYLTAGYVAYARSLPDGAPRRQRYLTEMSRAMAAAIKYKGAPWERGQLDGYSDTIEGAQYLLPFLSVAGASRWVDDQSGILMAYQKSDGLLGGTYLDGNFIRTALLYAFFRTQGAHLTPWRPGLRLGAIASPDGLIVSVASDVPWSGQIIFDRPRHRDYLNIADEYPRLNGWTEWFIVDSGADYEITPLIAGQPAPPKHVSGKELISGLAVALAGDPIVFKIAARQTNETPA